MDFTDASKAAKFMDKSPLFPGGRRNFKTTIITTVTFPDGRWGCHVTNRLSPKHGVRRAI